MKSEYHEGLNSDQTVQIRLSSSEIFVDKRKKFVFSAFVDFKPI